MHDIERNKIIDVLKGIAVLSVILGHAIQRYIAIYEHGVAFDNYFFKIIYSYHMPLFMLLSGYTLAKYTKKYDYRFIKKRFLRLIIPTIVWSYLIWIMRNYDFVGIKELVPFPNSAVEYSKLLLIHPDYIIWFLYVVFVCDIFIYALRKINLKKELYQDILFSIIFYLILKLLPNTNFGINLISTYFPIFMFGYFLNVDYFKELSNYALILVIPLYILLFIIYKDTYLQNMYVYYLMSMCAIFIIYKIVINFRSEYLKNILSFFGKYSLEIYLCQCLCLNIGFGSGIIKLLSIFISATIISILLTFITNKNKLLSFVLYGKTYKKV